MDQRQRHHRRQQSAPLGFEISNIPHPPTMYHTVGPAPEFAIIPQAMEQPRHYIPGSDAKVGITNTGQTQQHYLQVTQQHGQARPGQQQQPHIQPLQLSEQQFRVLQHQKLDAEIDTLIHGENNAPIPPSNQHFVKIERTRSNPEGYHSIPMPHIGPDNMVMYPIHHGLPASIDVPQAPSPRRQNARSQIASNDWSAALQPNWTLSAQRPLTPPNQNSQEYFPYTPAQTPHRAYGRLGQRASQPDMHAAFRGQRKVIRKTSLADLHQAESGMSPSVIDPNATLRPSKRRLSATSLLEDNSAEAYFGALPSPPQTAPLKSSRKFDAALIPGSSLEDIPRLAFSAVDNGAQSNRSSTTTSPRLSSIPESPLMGPAHTFDTIALGIPSLDQHRQHSPMCHDHQSNGFGAWDLPVRPPLSPRIMSMTDIGLDAVIEDTGVSSEEVQAYVSEPDPETGKWTCMYPECGRLFSRKENIRSHIQTHLGDRQYRCLHCDKRFVRQHDLKRHAKIHSGVKPYPCRCGNSFARHDALTRHRQRGICDGGFAGIVKKSAKRGRPKKDRMDDEERTSRSRKREGEKSYASSDAGTSESSFPESPMDQDPADGEDEPVTAGASVSADAFFSFPPSAFSYTPPMSPYSTGRTPSPTKDITADSALTPPSLNLEDDHEPESKIIGPELVLSDIIEDPEEASQPSSPPELSHSSPPSSANLRHLDLFKINDSLSSANEPDFDMLADQYTDNHGGHFESSWDEGGYMEFDKDNDSLTMNGFTRGFDEENLY